MDPDVKILLSHKRNGKMIDKVRCCYQIIQVNQGNAGFKKQLDNGIAGKFCIDKSNIKHI